MLDDSVDRLFNGNGVLFNVAAESVVVPFVISDRPFMHRYLLYIQSKIDEDSYLSLFSSPGF
jgi:hypothetical protein